MTEKILFPFSQALTQQELHIAGFCMGNSNASVQAFNPTAASMFIYGKSAANQKQTAAAANYPLVI